MEVSQKEKKGDRTLVILILSVYFKFGNKDIYLCITVSCTMNRIGLTVLLLILVVPRFVFDQQLCLLNHDCNFHFVVLMDRCMIVVLGAKYHTSPEKWKLQAHIINKENKIINPLIASTDCHGFSVRLVYYSSDKRKKVLRRWSNVGQRER